MSCFFLAMNNALCLQRIDIAGDVGAMDIGEGGKIGERWKFTDEIAAVLLKCAIFMDERNKEGIDLAFLRRGGWWSALAAGECRSALR